MTRKRFVASVLVLTLISCKSGPSGHPATPGEAGTSPATVSSAPTVPPAAAATPAGAPKKIRTIEGITEYALDNGMQVLLFPDNSKDTVTVDVIYQVGSRHEGAGETGMAHLLEHMMFKGSKNAEDLKVQLGKRGAEYNANTWYDRTQYYEILPASEDNLDWALGMEADRMVNAFIRQEDLSSEFSVVRNEMEIGENSPPSILEERMLSTAYLWHNYGKSTIGSRSDVEKVPATSLKRFYEKYYQPDNSTLVVVGKFDGAKALDTINKTFGVLPRPTRKLEPSYTVEPAQDGERTVTLRRVGDVGIVGLGYHVLATSDPDAPAVDAVADLLTAEPAGRLYQALVKTGLATSVSASNFPSRDPGEMLFYATVAAGKPLEPVKNKMIEIVEGLGTSKVTEEEVARYRAKEKKNAKLLFTSTQDLLRALAESVSMGDWRLLFLIRDRGQAVKLDQVQRVATTFFKQSNRTLGLFIPEKSPDRAPLTERPDVAAMVKDYNGKPPISEGEAFVYSLDNIDKRTTRGKLKSGLAWAFLPKETRGDAVVATLNIHYGSETDFKGKVEAAEMLGDLLRRGTKTHSFQQITDLFDGLEAEVNFRSGVGSLQVSFVTTHENLPAVLKLVDEVLRQPTFPATELETIRKERLSALEEERTDPQALTARGFRRKLHPYGKDDVRYVATVEEKIERIKAVKLDDIKKLAALLGGSNAQLVVVGDFDAKRIGDETAARWNDWKSPKPWKRIENKFAEVAGSEEVIDTPDKENAFMIAGLALKLRDDDADYAALEVVNYVLGGSGFTSRLMKRLREKEGLSYGAGSQLSVDSEDPVGFIACIAFLAPQNTVKGLAALVDEVERISTSGVTAEELATAKTGYVKEFERNLSSDGFVSSLLEESLYLNRGLDFYAKLTAKVGGLTLEQVNTAAKKWVKPSALIKVTGADKKKASGTPAPAAPAPAPAK